MGFLDALKYGKYVKEHKPGRVVVKHPRLADADRAAAAKARFDGTKGLNSIITRPDGTAIIEYDPNILKESDLLNKGLDTIKWLEQ